MKPKTKKGKSHRPKHNPTGDEHSLGRKLAALKKAEKAKAEANKTLNPFAAKAYKQKEKQPKTPRKQQNLRKSLSVPPFKQDIIELENSSDEETTLTKEQEKTTTTEDTKNETNTETPKNISRQSERAKKTPDWFDQNVMVSNVEGGEEGSQEENADQYQTTDTLEQGLEAELNPKPNFLDMTKEEIIDWINN